MFFNNHPNSVNHRKLILGVLMTISTVVFFTTVALAATEDPYGLNTTANKANLDTNQSRDIPTILGQGVNYLFGILGVVFLTVALIGGYLWMTAGGNEESVKKAKAFIINGINGMIVIFISYALVYLVLAALRSTNGV